MGIESEGEGEGGMSVCVCVSCSGVVPCGRGKERKRVCLMRIRVMMSRSARFVLLTADISATRTARTPSECRCPDRCLPLAFVVVSSVSVSVFLFIILMLRFVMWNSFASLLRLCVDVAD